MIPEPTRPTWAGWYAYEWWRGRSGDALGADLGSCAHPRATRLMPRPQLAFVSAGAANGGRTRGSPVEGCRLPGPQLVEPAGRDSAGRDPQTHHDGQHVVELPQHRDEAGDDLDRRQCPRGAGPASHGVDLQAQSRGPLRRGQGCRPPADVAVGCIPVLAPQGLRGARGRGERLLQAPAAGTTGRGI